MPNTTSAAHASAPSAVDAAAGDTSHGTGKGKDRPVDEYGNPVLPWAFIDCDTDDLVVLIAHMLNKLMEHNDQVVLTPSSLTRFHSRAPPAISVIDYLRRIVKYTNLERLPLLSLLAYIDITCNSLPTFTLSSLTVHRFLIAGVTAGSKALCDVFCTNAHYAKVGGIKVNELNALERELVKVTDWNLCVHAELLQQYYTSLIRSHGHYAQSTQPATSPFTLFPLPEPQKGCFDELEAELARTIDSSKNISKNIADGERRDKIGCGIREDTEMDGSPQLERGDSNMEVDGDAEDSAAISKPGLVEAGHASRSGLPQQPNTMESSPLSSDVAPSSQSASSNASGQGLGVETTTASSPLQAFQQVTPVTIRTDDAKPSSITTSRTTSAYSSPQTQASGSGSLLSASLKSTTSASRRPTGIAFPLVMASGPASPRMDTTSAGAEEMVGIVSASEVQTYIGELADKEVGSSGSRPSSAHRRISSVHDGWAEQDQGREVHQPGIARNDTVRQSGRGRRASSPGNTFRHSATASVPIATSLKRLDVSVPALTSLSRSLTTEQSKPISRQSFSQTVSQPQRFKRFMGSLFRSKSVSSATEDDDRVHPSDREDAQLVASPSSTLIGGSSHLQTRSPRRTQSTAPAAPPPIPTSTYVTGPSIPDPNPGLRVMDSGKSPSIVSTRSATHPGSVTPRIRTRSQRSTSPTRVHRAPGDTEMQLDDDAGASDDRAGFPHDLKRGRSRREPPSGGTGPALSSSVGKGAGMGVVPGGASGIDWKCRSTGSAGLEGVVTGLGLG